MENYYILTNMLTSVKILLIFYTKFPLWNYLLIIVDTGFCFDIFCTSLLMYPSWMNGRVISFLCIITWWSMVDAAVVTQTVHSAVTLVTYSTHQFTTTTGTGAGGTPPHSATTICPLPIPCKESLFSVSYFAFFNSSFHPSIQHHHHYQSITSFFNCISDSSLQ